jgi:hypothetical protein
MRKCVYCRKPLKEGKNPNECYPCICVERFVDKGGNAPRRKTETAIKHLSKKGPGLLKIIFGIIG